MFGCELWSKKGQGSRKPSKSNSDRLVDEGVNFNAPIIGHGEPEQNGEKKWPTPQVPHTG